MAKNPSHKRIFIIFNPAAKSFRVRSQRGKVLSLRSFPRVTLRFTRKPGDAHALAKRAVKSGYEIVVAAGGDGTVNAVLNGIVEAGGADKVCLGVLPLGTMNVFANELGLGGRSLLRCWNIIRQGQIKEIDLAKANEHYFAQLAGIGFDAQAVATVEDTGLKQHIGPLSYLISAAMVAARPQPQLQVETEAGVIGEGSFVLVGNGRFYGGPIAVFKEAALDDGKLDIIIFRNISHLDIVRYLQGVFFGTHLKLPDVDYFQATQVTVRSKNKNVKVPFEVDGELVGEAPVHFSVVAKGLRVLVPAVPLGPRAKSLKGA